MGHTTISLSEETKERFDRLRPEDSRSAGEFVDQLLDNWDGVETNEDIITDVRQAVQTVEERTGRIERQVEDLQR